MTEEENNNEADNFDLDLSFKDKNPTLSQVLKWYKHQGLVGEEKLAILQTLLAIKKKHFGVEALSGCLIGNTKVYTEYGATKLIDVINNKSIQKIQSLQDGKIVWNNITRRYKKGEKDVYILTLESGKELFVTENHLILTNKGWRKVQDLNKLKDVYIFSAAKLQAEDTYDPSLAERARLLGYFTGDGSINGEYSWKFTSQDKEIITDIKSTLRQEFNCTIKQSKNVEIQYSVSFDKKDYSFKEWIIDNDCNKLCYDKTIPSWVYSSKEYARNFLIGLLATDGHVYKDLRGYEITLANKRLIKDVVDLLLVLGVHSRYNYHRATCNGTHFDSWRLYVTHTPSVLTLSKECPLPVRSKYLRQQKTIKHKESINDNTNVDVIPSSLFPDLTKGSITRKILNKYLTGIIQAAEGDIFFDKLRSISYYGKEEVYDLATETHNFIADGIVVHNSGKSATVDLLCNYKKYGTDILLPQDFVYILGLASKTAAHYDNKEINKAKLIYIEELQKAGNSLEMTELLKNLGEGKDNSRKVRDQANRNVKDYTIKGDKGVVYTLALENTYKNDPEMKRRYVVLTTDVSQKQTKEVVRRKGKERFARDRLKILEDGEIMHLKTHVADCMTLPKIYFENPFAEYLAEKMPTPDQKVRSFIDHYFNLIEASALYHYKERLRFQTGDKKPREHIFITIQDLIYINILYATFFNRDVHSVPPLGMEILEAFRYIDKENTVNSIRNHTLDSFSDDKEAEIPRVWASIVDIRDSLKENQNIILSHKVTKDIADALYNAGYLMKNTGQKGMVEYCVADKVIDFSDEINWEECFNDALSKMKEFYPDYYDEWLSSQQIDGVIKFTHPLTDEEMTLDGYIESRKQFKINKTKTLLRSNNIYNSIEKIKKLQPIKKSELFNHITAEEADELITNDILVTDSDLNFVINTGSPLMELLKENDESTNN